MPPRSNKEKMDARIKQLREQRMKGNGKPKPNKHKKVHGKSSMGKDFLKEAPVNTAQYIVLQSFISKHTPQKSDYDGVITHEVLPFMDDPSSNEHLRKRIEYWSTYHNVDVHVALVGRWVPWNPRKDVEHDSIIYKDERLNNTMRENIKNKEHKDDIFDDSVKYKMRKAYLESKMDAKKLGDMNNYRSEEQDGPMNDTFWQKGDKDLLVEIMEDKQEEAKAKKKLGIKENSIRIEKKHMIVEEEGDEATGDYDILVDSEEEED